VCAYALLVPFMGSAVYDSWKDFSRPLLPMFAFAVLCAFETARARTQARPDDVPTYDTLTRWA
jgi:hypothetical protein